MTALELIARLREKGIRIAARDGELELDAPRGALDEELRLELVERKPELLRLLSWSRRSSRDVPLVPASRDQVVPLSWSQQRLWFLDQLEPNSAAYNISWTVRLSGDLNAEALQAALNQLVMRHESLRTIFAEEQGTPRQQILPALQVMIDQENLAGVSDEQMRVRLAQLAASPFDLANGPLLRVNQLRLSASEHILLVVIHHIVADGASMRVLFRELAALYDAILFGQAAELPELPVQYADFAVWQRQWLDSEELQRQTSYWLERLDGLPPLLELPTDRPRGATMRYRGASVLRVLPPALANDLRALGREHGCTLFMVMLSAFFVLLQRYSGRTDLAVGTPMGGRPRTGLENLIGFFINTVVMRADLEGDPGFADLLHQVRDIALGAHANQELPFEKLVEELQPERELSYSPIFQVMFDLQEEPRWRLPLKNLEVVPEVVFSSRTSSFDLTLSVRQAENGLDAMFEYDTDLFDEASIERLASHYQTLLESIVAEAGQAISALSLTSPQEQQTIVKTWGSVAADYPSALTLQALFEKQAVTRPEAIALCAAGHEYSYAEVNRRANRLAHRLQAMGVGPGDAVALSASRCAESFVAMLGILKSGGLVVPLDPDYPEQRQRLMLDDAGARLVLLPPANAGALASAAEQLVLASGVLDSPDYPDSNPTSPAGPETPAFLLYTSGSAGKPKGVCLLHQGLVNYIWQLGKKTDLTAADRVLQFASPSFDICVEETFAAWLHGAALVIREPDMNLSVQAFLGGCERHAISWASLPTAWWHELCNGMEQGGGQLLLPATLRSVVIGGEKARRDVFAIWQKFSRNVRLFNTYGPTETSIAATWCELTHIDPAAGRDLPIGHPVPNVFAWVLDEHMRPLPAGVPGELYIGGVGVAPGYWRQAEKTAACFLQDPFSEVPAAQLYKTGDRARYLADGRLVFLGRADNQVKVRGHRIEPGEIEAVVESLDDVTACAVRAHVMLASGEKRLVAYYVGALESAELRRRLRNTLPEYMLPAALMQLSSLPLTANGKLDYHALPAPEFSRNSEQDYVAPRNELEQQLADIWVTVLGVDRVGVFDNFFSLGGHSLLATQVMSRVRNLLSADVPLRELFEAPTVAALAAMLAERAGADDSLPLTRRDPAARLLPLSWAQQRLWVLDRLESESTAYNLPWTGMLQGNLDLRALQGALDLLVARHESLRTAFGSSEGEPVQLIADALLPVMQLETLGAVAEEVVRERLRELIAQPFDLNRPPLFRVHLLRLAEDRHVLLLLLHHIVADGWSLGVMFRELAHSYNRLSLGQRPELTELPVQYADYAIWQRQWLTGRELERQSGFWLKQLADAPALLNLPTDFPRPAQQSYAGGWVAAQLAPQQLEQLRELAARKGVTLFMLLLAAFKTMLASQSGSQDVIVGTPVAGRRRAELEGLIGCFLNTLVLRTEFSGSPPFSDLLQRVRQVTLDAYDHQDLPFEKLLELVQPERSTAHTPVVQVLFNLHNAPAARLELQDLQVEGFDIARGTAKFDLSAALVEGQSGLSIGFEFNSDIFAESTAIAMLAQYRQVLERVIADADVPLANLVRTGEPVVPVLPDIAARGGQPIVQQRPGTLSERFAAAVATWPGRSAVEDATGNYSYAQLDAWSSAVAATICAESKGRQCNVGLLLGHDAQMIAGLLGIVRAGCAYVPLDLHAPAARLRSVAADAAVNLIVSNGATAAEFADTLGSMATIITVPDQPPAAQPAILPLVNPHELAYILFTSGSTGKPKGVMQTHRNVLHHVDTYAASLSIGPKDRLSLFSRYGFDASVMDIFGALLNGACLQPFDVLESGGPQALRNALRESGTTVLHATPTVFRFLFEDDGEQPAMDDVRAVVLGGEVATAADFRLFQRWFVRPAVFVNGLGPSESTTALQFIADHDTLVRGEALPVGLPVAATETFLLDESGAVSPIAGELCIRSDYLATGYWNLPELTAQRFREDIAGCAGRVYRTGDNARYLPDGQLVFTGRLDQQLKLRGHRIEPAEIEGVIHTVAGVERCAVLLRDMSQASSGAKRVEQLVAYVQGAASMAAVEAALRAQLPEYMVPAIVISVPSLPLLPNGKLDSRALPVPEAANAPGSEQPTTDMQKQIQAVWAELLGHSQVGIHDNFFALGGHSLVATRVVARLRDLFRVELSLRELFVNPTIAGLAEAVASSSQDDAALPVLQPHSTDDLPPLSWAQQRLWFLDQLEPENAAYNLHWAAHLEGSIVTTVLQSAVDDLLLRHDSLRTTFDSLNSESATPVQVIAPQIAVPIVEEPLIGATEERLHSRLLELIRQPFNLRSGPLLRFYLLRYGEERSVLLLTVHHIIADGWSIGVLMRELGLAYNARLQGQPADLPDLPVQYPDFAVWQRAWLSGGELERQEAYWRQQLAGLPPLLELPLDHARPPVQRFRGAWVSASIDCKLTQALRDLASRSDATLFMVLLAAFKTLIMRHTGREDVVIGTPIAGRRRTELEGLIGFFLNTLVLRSSIEGNPTFLDVLARVKKTTLEAFDHQELPFEKLLEIVQPARSTAYPPVVQVMFNLHNEPGGGLQLEGAEVKPFSVDRGTAKFDLSVAVLEADGGLQVGFEYNTDLFERRTVEGLLEHYLELLDRVARQPEKVVADLHLAGSAQVAEPTVAFEEFPARQSGATLVSRFAEMAARYPERPAVCQGAEFLTYRELDGRSNAVAQNILRSAKPGARIALLLGHNTRMLSGLLGVLKAGCAYVPLDPDLPAARLRELLVDADVTAIVSESAHGALLDEASGAQIPVLTINDADIAEPLPQGLVAPESLAYILFTSGSTGKPKGVMQNHRNVLHHVGTYTNALHISSADRLSLFSAYGFDASVMDIFGAFLNGACLYPVDIRAAAHPGEVLDAMSGPDPEVQGDERVGITLLHATPTVFRFLMRHKVCRHEVGAVRAVVLGGEEARADDFALFKRHFAPPAVFVNGLGPSESTLATQFFANHKTHLPGQVVPVGEPVAGTEICILDEAGKPAGIAGELAIRSRFVSLGYWQKPALTAERFAPDPQGEQGVFLYRTGDRVRLLPDGQLVYAGRIDGQIKIRGHRIEPGEIEARLTLLDEVERCAVVMHTSSAAGGTDETRLVAYVVAAEEGDAGASIDSGALRRALRAALPEYMVPQIFMFMPELPLMPNGKVDRHALPVPDPARDESRNYVQPRTDTERQLAGIWSDILGVPKVGIYDDFFELGGHSLMAAQLVARVTESLQVGLPLRRLFDTPTIAGLAEHVETLQWALHNQPE